MTTDITPEGSIAPPPGAPTDPTAPGAPDVPDFPDAPAPETPGPEITPSEPPPFAPDEGVDHDPPLGGRAL
jgi:hypothetical protein